MQRLNLSSKERPRRCYTSEWMFTKGVVGSCWVTVLDADGHELEQRKLGTEKATLLGYFGKIAKPAAVAVEATFNGYYFLELVEPLGLELHLVHPWKTRAIASARSTGVPPVKKSSPRPRWPCCDKAEHPQTAETDVCATRPGRTAGVNVRAIWLLLRRSVTRENSYVSCRSALRILCRSERKRSDAILVVQKGKE